MKYSTDREGPAPRCGSGLVLRWWCAKSITLSVHKNTTLDQASDNNDVFAFLVAARLIHPAGSKRDTVETLTGLVAHTPSYANIKRHLLHFATLAFRNQITTALARFAGIDPGVMVLV